MIGSSIERNGGIAVPEDAFDNEINQRKCAALMERFGPTMRNVGKQNPDLVEAWQFERLKRLVDHAFQHSPFYRELYSATGYELGELKTPKHFEDLPIVSKEMIIDAGEAVVCRDRNRTVIEARTSGSTGKAFTVRYDRTNALWYSLESYRQFANMLGKDLDPKRWIYVVHHIRGWFSSIEGAYPTFVLSHIENPGEFVDHARKLQPQILWTMPGYLRQFLQSGYDLSGTGIELVVTNSESSTREERQAFEDQLGISVRDEYASEELGVIASECSQRHHHVNQDSVHLSFYRTVDLTAHGVAGTDLWNFTAPFIKYDQGDLVTERTREPCACGQRSLRFGDLLGRRDSNFVHPKGGYVNSSALTNTCDSNFNDAIGSVESFRFIQRKSGYLEFIYTSTGGAVSQASADRFRADINALFGMEQDIRFTRVDELPPLKSYKRRKVISELTN